MEEKILEAYQELRAEPRGGNAPELTAKDREVAKLAASCTESELRQAVVMRGAYERKQRKLQKPQRGRKT